MRFEDTWEITYLDTKLKTEDKELCNCRVSFANDTWVISGWFTNKDYLHKGFGNLTLKHVLQQLMNEKGEPNEIRYIWNQANPYVMDWLQRHFSPVSIMPAAVQKMNENEDIWEAHIYILDKEKVFEYFDIEREQER